MDYKEKYEQVIKNLRSLIKNDSGHVIYKHDILESVPELKESEDRKIKSDIQYAVRCAYGDNSSKTESILAWLDEQKTSEEALQYLRENHSASEMSDFQVAMNIAVAKSYDKGYNDGLEKQGEQKPALPKWKYKKDNTPLLRDSLILNKYGCVTKSPSGAIVSDVWVIDYAELAKLPKEEFEKQDEQKPAYEPKFHEGEWLIYENGSIYYVNKVYEHTYELVIDNGDKPRIPHELIDKKARLWSIQDAKDGDVLSFNDGHGSDCIELIKSITGKKIEFWFCLTNGKYYEVFDGITPYTNLVSREDATPATKEQRDLLFQKMQEAGYTFDFEKKDLKKIEQPKLTEFEDAIKDMMDDYRDAIDDNDATVEEVKEKAAYLLSLILCKPAWSEDDEQMYNAIANSLDREQVERVWNTTEEKADNWLKSLKERYTWKPSEEQLNNILDVLSFDNCTPKRRELLESLYNDLKKL